MYRNVFFALVLSMSCALPMSAGADEADDKAAIAAVWDSYETARMAGDADAWLALWDEEGVQMPPGMPARGKDVMIGGVPKAFTAMPASAMEIVPVETVILGDMAFSRGTYLAALTVKGNEVNVDGKFMTIFRRQPDGAWKIYRDIFNSNK